MSLTKSVLTKSDRNKRIQKIQKKVVRGERGSQSHYQIPYEKIITREGQTQIIRCKTCYYHSTAGVINHRALVLSSKCHECLSENLEYYSASTNRLLKYILNNIN